MKNKIVLVTGSTDGIGKQTALDLAGMEATVLIHGKDTNRCSKVKEEIQQKTGNEKIYSYIADLGSFKQIHQLSRDIHSQFDRIDALINNAGVYNKKRSLSEDGYEKTFAINHLAVFCLTGLLLDLIRKSDGGRIITVSSMIHAGSIDFDDLQGERGFSGSDAYSLSKLCNILFTFELAEKLHGTGITANCLHPGVINTKLLRAAWSGGSPVSDGSRTTVYLASSPDVAEVSGKYFVRERQTKPSDIVDNGDIRRKLWRLSEKITNVTYAI
jgi:NAD(P)-dependent dehydrogenase (short-subunit alcohol dehydrogenase family)